MNKYLKLFCIANLLLTITIFSQPVGGLHNVVDAKASSMGQTEILSTTGSNSLFINPAMMAVLETPQFQGGGSIYLGSISDEYHDEEYSSYDHSYKMQPKITHLSFVYPYKLPESEIKLAFGGGYYSYYDMSANEEIEYTTEGGYTRKIEIDHGRGLNVITLGGSINFEKIFYFGLSFNQSFNSGRYEEIKSTSSSSSYSTEVDATFESSSFFNFSGYVQPTEKLGLALFYRTELSLEGDKYKTTDSDGNTDSEDWNVEYTHPSVLGLSAAYNISESFLIVGEYQTRQFSDYEVNNRSYPDPIDDGACYRIGAEYNTGTIPLRFGLFTNSVFEREEEDNDDAASLIGITVGTGFYKNNFGVDFAATFSTYSTKENNNDNMYEYSYSFFKFIVTAKYSL